MAHTTVETQALRIDPHGEVSTIVMQPTAARCALVLGHGAGAGMKHPFMEAIARHLADRGIATFRYEFPYMARGKRRPDPRPILIETVRAALSEAARQMPALPLFAGGKSMGGRMTSHTAAAADGGVPDVRGIVFLGFPLHPAGEPGTSRAAHLDRVDRPMLFLQGTRDRLADLALLRPVCERLASRATLVVIDGADHSFNVLKRSGRTPQAVLKELADRASAWMDDVLATGGTSPDASPSR